MDLDPVQLRILAAARVILVEYATDVFTPNDLSESATRAAHEIDEVLDGETRDS